MIDNKSKAEISHILDSLLLEFQKTDLAIIKDTKIKKVVNHILTSFVREAKSQLDLSISQQLPKELPFSLEKLGIDDDTFGYVYERCSQGTPQEVAWKAVGLYHRFLELKTLYDTDVEFIFDESKCYAFLERAYARCLSTVAETLYLRTQSNSDAIATQAARLLLEYNEKVENKQHKRVV